MYGYGYPIYYSCPGNNNDNSNSSWIWIIIIVFILFFLFWGNDSKGGCPGCHR